MARRKRLEEDSKIGQVITDEDLRRSGNVTLIEHFQMIANLVRTRTREDAMRALDPNTSPKKTIGAHIKN